MAVERYLSPPSGKTATISLPLFSGRFASSVAAHTAAPDDIPIKKGDKTFISIRNVPYSDLEILDVKADRRKIVLPTLSSKTLVIVVEDESQPDLYDVVVTLTDKAKITKDGAVVGGNKVKLGLPITLEGPDYKFTGSVSDINIVDTVNEKLGKDINTTDDVQ